MGQLKLRNTRKFMLIAGILLVGGGIFFDQMLRSSVDHYFYNRTTSFSELQRIETQQHNQALTEAASFAKVPPPVAFEEIEAFDEDAHDWSTVYSATSTGVLVFDANNDGRLDVYICQDGANWARPTDVEGVLLDTPRHQRNLLYLNQGNTSSGYPIFRRIDDPMLANDQYQAEELLVENFLFPRSSIKDSTDSEARKATIAVAADFNSDGLQDLLVGNALPGMPHSHPKTQRLLPPTIYPIGRETRTSSQPMSALGLHLIEYKPHHEYGEKRASARGQEHYGANSLFLNRGDRDGDGIPEWEDVSRKTGIEGMGSTHSLSVGDLDLDGDLDVYVGNAMDADFWPGAAKAWAGGANELFINDINERGEIAFNERASEMNVDGVYDNDNPMPPFFKLRRLPYLPVRYSLYFPKLVPWKPDFLVLDGQEAERGQISWATILQDVNHDGYPDIWVANDLGYMRLYLNNNGKDFSEGQHARSGSAGTWMSFAPGDFNGDLKEDLFLGNNGSSYLNIAFGVPSLEEIFDPEIGSGVFFQLAFGLMSGMHSIVNGADIEGELEPTIRHSLILPPDTSIPGNIRSTYQNQFEEVDFQIDGLDPYEFTWGSTSFDVQNDGLLDFYFHGSLTRAGRFWGMPGSSPGRLLVNATKAPEQPRFIDLTAEHRVFNILELKYDRLELEGYIYRKAPLQNWGKRDTVYSYDKSVFSEQGPGIMQRIINHDLIATIENGRAALGSDLNGDGFTDLILRNLGGYDSRSSTAKNLKVRRNGVTRALPTHDHNSHTLTEYDPGRTRVFINRYQDLNWIKIRLLDDSSSTFNRNAIGAVVTLNNTQLRVQRAGSGSFASNAAEDLHFGMGNGAASELLITWPDKERTKTRHTLDSLRNGRVSVSKLRGVTRWEPLADL